MISLFICLFLLVGDFFAYGKFAEKTFGPNDRRTPKIAMEDGTDYVPTETTRTFLIRLLNIAGLGSIFGALAGAAWGPSVFLRIILGAILNGGVCDYIIGMMPMHHKGASISELTDMYLGNEMKQVMRVFSVVLLVLVGVSSSTGPTSLLAMLTPKMPDMNFWPIVVPVYYFFVAFVLTGKLIGKIYPIFGICLIVMVLSVGGMILFSGNCTIPGITLQDLHPNETPIWPVMLISVACGAISGFHITRSLLMARCMRSEKSGRSVFYGAVVAEDIIALIWTVAGAAFYNGTGGPPVALGQGQVSVVYEIYSTLLGSTDAVITMIGVIAYPTSSADTVYRNTRLTLTDRSSYDQKPAENRLVLTVPLLGVGAFLTQVDVQIIWRYFSWSDQTLAMIALWTTSAHLLKRGRAYLMTALPATFMSIVSCTYILMAGEEMCLPTSIAYPIGILFAAGCLGMFTYGCTLRKDRNITLPVGDVNFD